MPDIALYYHFFFIILCLHGEQATIFLSRSFETKDAQIFLRVMRLHVGRVLKKEKYFL